MPKKTRERNEGGLVATLRVVGVGFNWLIKGLTYLVFLPCWAYILPAKRNIKAKTKLGFHELQQADQKQILNFEEQKVLLREIVEQNIARRKKHSVVPKIAFGFILIGAGVAIIALFVNPVTLLTIGLPVAIGIGVALIEIVKNFKKLEHDEADVQEALKQVHEILAEGEIITDSKLRQELTQTLNEVAGEFLIQDNPSPCQGVMNDYDRPNNQSKPPYQREHDSRYPYDAQGRDRDDRSSQANHYSSSKVPEKVKQRQEKREQRRNPVKQSLANKGGAKNREHREHG